MDHTLPIRAQGLFFSLVASIGLWAALLGPAAQAQSPPKKLTIYQRTVRSTVWILAKEEGGRLSTGAGVLVDAAGRYVVTNYHVVRDHKEVSVFFPRMEKNGEPLKEKEKYLAGAVTPVLGTVKARDPKRDLALIQLQAAPKDAPAIPIAKESPGTSELVHSVGNPGSSGSLWVYTQGNVRSVYDTTFRSTDKNGDNGFKVSAKIIETSSPVNPGDSGGPVVNDKGELVGITQGFNPKAQLVSIAIDISEVHRFLKENKVKIPTAPASPRVTTAASDTAPKKPAEKPAETAEREAALKLRLSKELLKDGKRAKPREWLQEIVDKYPNTKAAPEARKLLEELNK